MLGLKWIAWRWTTGTSNEMLRPTALLILGMSIGFVPTGCAQIPAGTGEDATYRSIRPQEGSAMAVVVDDLPLTHTTQLLPLDRDGRLVGDDDFDAQLDAAAANLRRVLAASGSDISDVAKLNVYLARPDDAGAVRRLLANVFPGPRKPAVSYVITDLPHPSAFVAVDAVATSSRSTPNVEVYRSPQVYGPNDQSHAAVMPRGGRVYVSGQVAPGDIAAATAGTMQGLLATLAYEGLSAADVVQVKAFLHPMADVETVAETVRSYFSDAPAPPFVAVEWTGGEYLPYLSLDEGDGPLPIEIEVMAGRGDRPMPNPAGSTSYSSPPWLEQPRTYARVAEGYGGKMLYVSGLYGQPGDAPEEQLRVIYQTLGELLDEAGSDFNHLLKGTYYLTSEEADHALNRIRTEYYDASSPPTSSKMPVRGTGVPGTSVTLDMIGTVPAQ